jgi:hypothetical protein
MTNPDTTTVPQDAPGDSRTVTVVPAADEQVNVSKTDLAAMLREAVLAGQAQGSAPGFAPAAAVDAEAPADWSHNELLRYLVTASRPYDERTARAALAAVDKFYPVPVESSGDGV